MGNVGNTEYNEYSKAFHKNNRTDRSQTECGQSFLPKQQLSVPLKNKQGIENTWFNSKVFADLV